MKILLLFLILATNLIADDQRARMHYLNKEYNKAKVEYQNLIKKYPSNPVYLYNLGSAFYRLNKTNQAKFYYLKALKIQPAMTEAKANIKLINASKIDQTLINETFWISVFGFSIKAAVYLGAY